MKVKRLHPDAKLPTYGSSSSAGMDLYAVEHAMLVPGAKAVIPVGISIEIPDNVYGRIAPRSGLAVRYGINVHAGVIDPDYRGEINVCVINHGHQTWEVRKGDRIAQLILEQFQRWEPYWEEELTGTERGSDGFGSTGV